MDRAKIDVETAPGVPRSGGELVRRGWGSLAVIGGRPAAIFEYSSVMPDGFEVAIGHSYPTSCTSGDSVIYSSLCVGYDAETRLASFEVRGESARQLGRLMAGLPLDPTEP